MNEHEFGKLLHMLDLNHDGRIDYNEFLAVFGGDIAGESAHGMDQEFFEKKVEEAHRVHVNSAERHRSSHHMPMLKAFEVRQLLGERLAQHSASLRRMFRLLDENKTGTLDSKEVRATRARACRDRAESTRPECGGACVRRGGDDGCCCAGRRRRAGARVPS